MLFVQLTLLILARIYSFRTSENSPAHVISNELSYATYAKFNPITSAV